MAINCYYINNNSFHGLQISNFNTQELLMHFIIVFLQLLNRSVKLNTHFLIKTSKLSIILIVYMVPMVSLFPISHFCPVILFELLSIMLILLLFTI